MDFKHIIIDKNRGWRGLAKAVVRDDEEGRIEMIFSFSEPVWRDMLKGKMVVQDKDNYYVLNFDNLDSLPKAHQQRSVLIKNFRANITEVNKYAKDKWTSAEGEDWAAILNFRKNKNNHTTSDWNCIGIRVTPEI